MKKLFLSFFALAMGMTVFTSCEKEETASPLTIDKTQTATMKGYLFADLDLTKAGLEVVPAGTKVFGYITNADILDNSANGLWKDTVVVGTDGSYTFTFPIGFTSSTLNIVPLAFEFEQVQGFGVYDTTLPKVFANAGTTSASATAGGVIPQLSYTGTIRNDYQQMTKITGKLEAELDNTRSGNESLISKTITFYTVGDNGKSWYKTETLSSTYSIEVPCNTTVYIDYNFEESVKISDGNSKTYVFKTPPAISLGTFGTSATEKDIILTGTPK
jgi:hypothetical protein